MESVIKNTLVFILLISTTFSKDNEELEEYGFIAIKTDSMNVPFFIDGVFVGKHPLPEPIAVLPGFHEVGYIPPEIQNRKVRDNLSDGLKRVYVAPNDTLKVFLFYDYYLAQVKSLENEFKIQNYIGVGLFGILLYLLFSII